MAITQTYVDYGAGNDFGGTTFTDGAYTSATKVLAKNGAFTRTKVNHWLKLSSNAGGSIVAGYYKVATATDANSVILATDAGAGVDATDVKCTQATGTALLPFRSIQGALDIIIRDATNGDQINVKTGTAQVNQAALTLAIYGTPTTAAPLVIRGYTTSASDGGIGEINCNGVTLWAGAYQCVILADLDLHDFGDNHGVSTGAFCVFFRCKIHKGASTPSGKFLITTGGASNLICNCYLYDPGAGTSRGLNGGQYAINNYINMGTASTGNAIVNTLVCIGNIIVCGNTSQNGINSSGAEMCFGNTLYNSAAGTSFGVSQGNAQWGVCLNNYIEGWSGVGGIGIKNTIVGLVGYNGLYNNTNPYTQTHPPVIDLSANDVVPLSSPLTSPATGDFSVSTVLKAKGFPVSFLGSITNDYVDIGAAQRQEPAGGAVSISPSLGSVGAA